MRKFILIFILFIFFVSCVDGATKIGLDRLNWSQSIDGIKFSNTTPESTTGTLYNDSGTLKFNGSAVATEAINIESYGAIGDNATDNSAAIQAAIDVGMEKHMPVYIPGGIFVTDSPLIIDYVGAVEIFGNSRTIGEQSGKSVIRYTGDGAAIRINQSTPGSYIYWGEFHDFILRGDLTNDGIYIDHMSEFMFDRIWFYEFDTAMDVDEMDIGHVRDCLFSKCTNAIFTNDLMAVTIDGNNFVEIGAVLRFNYANNINIINNHMEVFSIGILLQNSPINASFNTINIIGNNFLNGNEYDMESRIFKINTTNASNKIELDAVNFIGNRVLMWDADYQIEVDVSGTSGLTYGYISLITNKFGYVDKSVISTDTGELRWLTMNNRVYSDKPYMESSYGTQIGGIDHTYFDTMLYGPLRLANQSGNQKGDIWIDAATNKLKFYNGTAVETINSS